MIANTSRQTLLTTDHQVSACSSRGCRTGRCPICSVVFFFISCNVGSALCVPTIHAYPSGSYRSATNRPKTCPLPGLGLLFQDSQPWRLFCRPFPRRETGPLAKPPTVLALRLPSAGFSGPSIKVVPCNASSAWMGLPSGPFMMPHLEKPRVPRKGTPRRQRQFRRKQGAQDSLLLSRCEVQ